MIRHIFAYILVLCCSLASLHAQVVINEVVSVNHTSLRVGGESPDWFELYNAGKELVSLSGWRVNDNPTPGSSELPSISLAPGETYVLYCSKMPIPGNEHRRMDFNISGSRGELLYLFDSDGQLRDVVEVPPLGADEAFARMPDGASDWIKMADASTPGILNVLGSRTVLSPPPGIYHAEQIDVSVSIPVDGAVVWVQSYEEFKNGEVIHSSAEIQFSDQTAPDMSLSLIPTNDQLQWNSWIWKTPEGSFPNAHSVSLQVQYGVKSGPVEHYSYFTNANSDLLDTLPIVHLRVDSADFFGYEEGIYVPGFVDTSLPYYLRCNYNKKGAEWVRTGFIEFYDNGKLGFSDSVKLRLHGSGSRYMPMKSIRVTFSSEVGRSKLHYPLFPESELTEFNAFVLRNSGQDMTQTMMRDGLLQRIVKRAGMNVDFQEYRPCIVFLNNEFWGVHNIREFLDERYIQDHYPEVEELSLLEHDRDPVEFDGINPVAGSDKEWQRFQEILELMGDLDDEEYAMVADTVDIDNVIDYLIVKLYFGVNDWPVRNVKLWRPEPAGKWRYMIFDQDDGLLDPEHNSIEHVMDASAEGWPNDAWSTLLFRRLLGYEPFRHQFYNRLSYLVQKGLSRFSMKEILDETVHAIDPQMERHIRRWRTPSSYERWREYVNEMYSFVDERQCRFSTMIKDYWGDTLRALECDLAYSAKEINLYPSPVHDEFTVTPVVVGDVYFAIYDIRGKRISQGVVQSDYTGSLHLKIPSYVEPGLYFLDIRSVYDSQATKSRIPFIKE